MLAQLCLEKMKERVREGKNLPGWKRERGQFFRDEGVKVRDWERQKVEKEVKFEEDRNREKSRDGRG